MRKNGKASPPLGGTLLSSLEMIRGAAQSARKNSNWALIVATIALAVTFYNQYAIPRTIRNDSEYVILEMERLQALAETVEKLQDLVEDN